jgi:hypothetical protein
MLQKYWSVTDQTREGAAGGSEWSKQVKSSSITDQILVKGWSKAGQRLVKGLGGTSAQADESGATAKGGSGRGPRTYGGYAPRGLLPRLVYSRSNRSPIPGEMYLLQAP